MLCLIALSQREMHKPGGRQRKIFETILVKVQDWIQFYVVQIYIRRLFILRKMKFLVLNAKWLYIDIVSFSETRGQESFHKLMVLGA